LRGTAHATVAHATATAAIAATVIAAHQLVVARVLDAPGEFTDAAADASIVRPDGRRRTQSERRYQNSDPQRNTAHV
jgi:hypothetical protein